MYVAERRSPRFPFIATAQVVETRTEAVDRLQAIAVLHAEDAGRFLAGMRRRLPFADAANVRVYGPGAAFLGSAHVAGGELIAGRLLSPTEVGGAVPAPLASSPRIEESESLPS